MLLLKGYALGGRREDSITQGNGCTWKKCERKEEKQLEKVLISNPSGLVMGSVQGIAGASVGDSPLLDGGDMINAIEY
jgi:hypothetical protein